MKELTATLVLMFLFALRCFLPLAITLAIGYVMNGLVVRWQAEEKAGGPCWEVKQCPPAQRNACPAYRRSGVACWQARQEAAGALPALCRTCPLFDGALVQPAV